MENQIVILYLLHTFEYAGSQKSLLSHAKSMRSLGYTIFFVGARGPFEQKLKELGIDYETRLYSPFSPFSIIGLAQLFNIVRKAKPRVIHSNNYWPHIEALFMKALLNIPVVSTFPGGPFYGKPLVPSCALLSYSAELKEEIVKHFGGLFENMLVIRNQFDLGSSSVSGRVVSRKKDKVRSFLLIGRLDRDKENSILAFLRAIHTLHERDTDIRGKIAGQGNIAGYVEIRAREINRKFGTEVVTLLGHKPDVMPHIEDSDFVVGMGRSAMEGMMCGKPVLVPCRGGSMSLVTKENADRHAYYNFSGRVPFTAADKEKDEKNLSRILIDLNYYNDVAAFSRRYIIDNYEVAKVQQEIQALYKGEINRVARESGLFFRGRLLFLCLIAYGRGMLQRSKNIGVFFTKRIREIRVRLVNRPKYGVY